MATTLGTLGVLRAGMFRINEEMIAALETADELPSLEIHHLWAKCSLCQHNFQDPDSRRAENFWWHVWGSNRRKLPPRTLARVLNEMCDGPTVVPPPKPTGLLQGVEDQRKGADGAAPAAGEEHISPLLSPKTSSLGSFSFATSCSSSPSAIVAAHGPGTSDKGKRPFRVGGSLSPSAGRPSPRQSLLEKMADAHAPVSRHRHHLPAFSFSPDDLPEKVIFEDDDEDVSEPPRSLIIQAPAFGLDASPCAREVPRGQREHPRAIVPSDARYQHNDLRAAPSDPGPATTKVITDPRHALSAGNTGPLVRVVGFEPFRRPLLGHVESNSQPHRRTHTASHRSSSSRQPFRPQMASCKEEPRPLAGPTGRGWELPFPVTAEPATLAAPQNSPVKWPKAGLDDAQAQGPPNAPDFITLPADLARPPIPETYKRPKAATLDTPMFGLRPFYLPSTMESRRATTIARREVERQFPPLQQQQQQKRPTAAAAGPRRRADGPCGGGGGGTGRVPHHAHAPEPPRAARRTPPHMGEVLVSGGGGARPHHAASSPAGGGGGGGRSGPGGGATRTKADMDSTTAGWHRAEPPPPGDGEPATLARRAVGGRPPASVAGRSKESLGRPGGSAGHLSFLLNQESDRAGR